MGEPYGDGALRGIIRVAKCEPDEKWAASTVLDLAEQLVDAKERIDALERGRDFELADTRNPFTLEDECDADD